MTVALYRTDLAVRVYRVLQVAFSLAHKFKLYTDSRLGTQRGDTLSRPLPWQDLLSVDSAAWLR